MLLSPLPWLYLLSPSFLHQAPVSWSFHTVLSPLIRCSCLLSPGAASFFMLWLPLTWLSCLLILPHAPVTASCVLPLVSCTGLLLPTSLLLLHDPVTGSFLPVPTLHYRQPSPRVWQHNLWKRTLVWLNYHTSLKNQRENLYCWGTIICKTTIHKPVCKIGLN